MKPARAALRCSCGSTMWATAPRVYRLSERVAAFLVAHDGPEHIVTDRDGVVVPATAVVEMRRAGGPELPGFDEVATKPEDRRYPG